MTKGCQRIIVNEGIKKYNANRLNGQQKLPGTTAVVEENNSGDGNQKPGENMMNGITQFMEDFDEVSEPVRELQVVRDKSKIRIVVRKELHKSEQQFTVRYYRKVDLAKEAVVGEFWQREIWLSADFPWVMEDSAEAAMTAALSHVAEKLNQPIM